MPTKPKLSNQPFTPRGAEAGPLPLPTEEEIVTELMADAGTAGEVWDALMPEYAGLLDAGAVEEEYDNSRAGAHIRPDDVVWPQGLEEPDA